MKEKKKKVKYVDDGHTIYDMSGLSPDKVNNKDGLYINMKERFAIVRAALSVYFPRLLLMLLAFIIAGVLMWLWLK